MGGTDIEVPLQTTSPIPNSDVTETEKAYFSVDGPFLVKSVVLFLRISAEDVS